MGRRFDSFVLILLGCCWGCDESSTAGGQGGSAPITTDDGGVTGGAGAGAGGGTGAGGAAGAAPDGGSGGALPGGTVVATELIDYSGMTSTEVDTFVGLCAAQGLSEITLRLRAMTDWSDEAPSAAEVAKAKTVITAANAAGMAVNLDLHTWYTTWDDYFRDSASGHATNRAQYLNYVAAAVDAFAGSDVKAWMVLNEPQARTATSSENDFVLSVIARARTRTSQPVSIRFMGGYSPTTGHYAAAIDEACDFISRNVYWDPQDPSHDVYGTTQAKMDAVVTYADANGKELWITEFGKSKSDLDAQRDYVRGFVQYATDQGIDRVFCWVSQPEGGAGEPYNIFDGYTPNPAFYELGSGS